MLNFFSSPYVVPLGGMAVAVVAIGFGAWRKVREMEIRQMYDARQKEMDHALKMKEMELEIARQK